MNKMSTPKRRRLGNTKVIRSEQNVENKNASATECVPYRRKNSENDINTVDRCDSPQLPCNQVKFLYDSVNNNSSDAIPCSPCAFLTPATAYEFSSINREENECNTKNLSTIHDDDIFDDMFHSKFEQSFDNHEGNKFRNEIEESFNVINDSLTNVNEILKNKSSHFETNDSFLLNIKDRSIIGINNGIECRNKSKDKSGPNNNFYGLPMSTKSLFKTYRNIDKFYDWQEECINLDTIKERRNLIYALPTSGGKTLVAEVLMLREVLNQKRNALFILPFVAIVQEKIWALSPFAVQLDFLVEEYAAGKGHIPPKKRRKKNSIYVATIEKGLALVRSLVELNRLHEIGLIVVDELHLIGEKGRGGTLEMLLSTVIFANQKIQIVGMSATIGNLHEIAKFLKADVFQRQFRPVELVEYVKLGNVLHKIQCTDNGMEIVPDRELLYDYSSAAVSLDPDLLGGLVSEVVPGASCLVFCPTKRNCENVANLLCKLQRREMTSHRTEERRALEEGLKSEGASLELSRCVRYGIAFHHAGLASDERAMIEHAFRSGVISVLCCTSTLAAGVNLPAQRVIVRAPLVGREFITLGAYRQMVGRAGRAGVCQNGESIIVCNGREWAQFRDVLSGGLAPARSQLRICANSLVLSAVALGLATCRKDIRRLLDVTLMAVAGDEHDSSRKSLCDDSLQYLLKSGALDVHTKGRDRDILEGDCYVYNDTELVVSQLGKASIKGCMDLSRAKQLVEDLEVASRGLVLMGSLHLLYLVTPHDADIIIRPDYRHYYSLYCNLDAEGMQTAKILGITEMNAVRMMTGKAITNVPERVLCRFYLSLMLHDLWRQVAFSTVADKYCIPRGTVQSVMSSSSAFASCAHKFCEEMPHLWTFRALFGELATRLQHCAAPELSQLMELPAVKKARALQLSRAGYKRVEDLAKASDEDLMSAISHLSRTAANQLISAARMMLIEKVENLRAEAEDVMEELNV